MSRSIYSIHPDDVPLAVKAGCCYMEKVNWESSQKVNPKFNFLHYSAVFRRYYTSQGFNNIIFYKRPAFKKLKLNDVYLKEGLKVRAKNSPFFKGIVASTIASYHSDEIHVLLKMTAIPGHLKTIDNYLVVPLRLLELDIATTTRIPTLYDIITGMQEFKLKEAFIEQHF